MTDSFSLTDAQALVAAANPKADFMPRYQEMLKDYAAKLQTYGTPAALALYLQEAGIQAHPGDSSACAISDHANATLDLPEDMKVQTGSSLMSINQSYPSTLTVGGKEVDVTAVRPVATVRQGEVAAEFIEEFDGYKHPDLVKPEILAMKRAKDERDRELMIESAKFPHPVMVL